MGSLLRSFGLSWLVSRSLAMFGVSSAARVPVAPSPAANLVQLFPTKGECAVSSSLWADGPVAVLVLRRPG